MQRLPVDFGEGDRESALERWEGGSLSAPVGGGVRTWAGTQRPTSKFQSGRCVNGVGMRLAARDAACAFFFFFGP